MGARSLGVLAMCIALSACGEKEPTGQVVAVVGGKEITATELKNELAGFEAPTPQIRKDAERAALERIISRKVLADAAKEAKIDKTPIYSQRRERMEDELLVQSWQEEIAKTVPTPGREEVEAFINEHPDLYANRKLFQVEQVRSARPADKAVLAGLQPLNSMQDVTNYLAQHKLAFRTGVDRVDVLALDPAIVDRVMKLPPNEIFVLPAGNLLVFNRIVSAEVVPVPHDVAVKHATQYLKAKRTQEAIARKFQGEIAAAKEEVKYSKAYAPPPAKAPAKTAVPPSKS